MRFHTGPTLILIGKGKPGFPVNGKLSFDYWWLSRCSGYATNLHDPGQDGRPRISGVLLTHLDSQKSGVLKRTGLGQVLFERWHVHHSDGGLAPYLVYIQSTRMVQQLWTKHRTNRINIFWKQFVRKRIPVGHVQQKWFGTLRRKFGTWFCLLLDCIDRPCKSVSFALGYCTVATVNMP